MRCSHKLYEKQAASADDCPMCLRVALSVLAEENARLREVEFDLRVSVAKLRTVIAHAHSETSIDGVAQNISSALFAEMHAVLEDAGWG